MRNTHWPLAEEAAFTGPVARAQLPLGVHRRAAGWLRLVRSRHDPVASTRARCQDPVVPGLMSPRRRDERCEPFEQLAMLHQDVCRAVAPAGLEPVCEASVWQRLESIRSQGWPRNIAT